MDVKLERDPKVVAELAEKRAWENLRFRAFLKASSLGIDELDAKVHRLYEEVAGQIDCCTCGNCCHEALPELHEQDVARLAGGLNLSRDALIERFLVPGEEECTFTFGTRPCPLLRDKCCSVYESRPHDCRSFPHLHKKEFVFRLMQAVSNCAICPIVYNVFERLKAELWHRSEEP